MKTKLMKELLELYEQVDCMKDIETKIIIEEYIAKKERKLLEALNG